MTEGYDNNEPVGEYQSYLAVEMEDGVPYVAIRDEDYAWWVEHGQLMFEMYARWRARTNWEVVGVEEEILVQPEPLQRPFLGYVDRRFRISDGRVILVDIKTGFRMPKNSPQLGEYQAASTILGRQVDGVAYYDARRGEATGIDTIPEWTPERLVLHVEPVEAGILGDEFPAKASAQNCRYCYVRDHCDKKYEGRTKK